MILLYHRPIREGLQESNLHTPGMFSVSGMYVELVFIDCRLVCTKMHKKIQTNNNNYATSSCIHKVPNPSTAHGFSGIIEQIQLARPSIELVMEHD